MLLNDSPAILTATIQGADGTYLGQATFQPGEQKNFTTNLSSTPYNPPGQPDVSMTPYTVVWQCASEGVYSMCSSVSPGSLVTANGCPGQRYCVSRRDAKKTGS
jgi:hypothetical protein